jgi:hypothetical protein
MTKSLREEKQQLQPENACVFVAGRKYIGPEEGPQATYRNSANQDLLHTPGKEEGRNEQRDL